VSDNIEAKAADLGLAYLACSGFLSNQTQEGFDLLVKRVRALAPEKKEAPGLDFPGIGNAALTAYEKAGGDNVGRFYLPMLEAIGRAACECAGAREMLEALRQAEAYLAHRCKPDKNGYVPAPDSILRARLQTIRAAITNATARVSLPRANKAEGWEGQ